MRIPESLASLTDEGIVQEVVRPLMSGKEAQVYLVRSEGELRVAKVYKESQDRTFKQRAEYTEGRRVRNSRDQRAMSKRSRHGREQDEAAWRSSEVDTLYRLSAAGVRVPKPHHFVDGVLIMELVKDQSGNPAPRLGDVQLDRPEATAIFHQLLADVVRMLCAGVVHGDLSDFNVLLAPDGPVIIDFPQSVNASSNQNARKLLLRDVDNLHRFLAAHAREQISPPYAQEMWQLYQRGELTPDTKLLGRFRASERAADTNSVLASIGDAEYDARRARSGSHPRERGPRRGSGGPIVQVLRSPGAPPTQAPRAANGQPARPPPRQAGHVVTAGRGEPARPPTAAHPHPQPTPPQGDSAPASPQQRKRRRRRRRGGANRTAGGREPQASPATPQRQSDAEASRSDAAAPRFDPVRGRPPMR
jgi:RIO kinase 1